MSPAFFVRAVLRGLRRGRLRHALFVVCVAIGVLGVGSVAALSAALGRGLSLRARTLLGGDLAVESRTPLPEPGAYLPARQAGAAHASLLIFPTTLRSASGASKLVEVKAVDAHGGAYPLAGTLAVVPPRPVAALLDDGSVLIARELADALGVGIADELMIGAASFRVAGLVDGEPDAQPFSMAFGPRVLMTRGGVTRTGLVGFGSRVRYRELYSFTPVLDGPALDGLRAEVAERLPTADGRVTVETPREGQPALRSTLTRVEQFAGLSALLSLLVASAGLAQLVLGFVTDARDETAVLRCLGLRPRDVFAIQLGRVAVLALIGSVLGVAASAALVTALGRVLPAELVPAEAFAVLPVFALLRALLFGLVLPLAVAMPALLTVWEVPPAQVLRADVQPLATPRWFRALCWALIGAAALGAALLEGGKPSWALSFAGGVLALYAVLALVFRGIARGVRSLPRARLSPLVWHGLSALGRPSSAARGSLSALAVGSLVVCSTGLVERTLREATRTAIPADAPTAFLVDVQPDEWADVAALARRHGASRVDGAPVVMARLAAVDGVEVAALVAAQAAAQAGGADERTRAAWVLTREQRITYAASFPPDNRILEGAPFRADLPGELSVEASFARDLGLVLGSVLRFDVQGVEVVLTVTSIRSVEWRSLGANFFLVAEPGPLDAAPQFRIGALRLPEAAEQGLQDALGASHPHISMLRVRGLLTRLRDALDGAALGVRVLAGFAALAALSVLVASVAASPVRQRREAALLKVLGLTARELRLWYGVEYALIGLVGGGVGAGFAYLLAWAFARAALKLEQAPGPAPAFVGALVAAAATLTVGLIGSARARRAPAADTLRE